MRQSETWRAPQSLCLPDFIIGGAMKCGTTTVHALLAKHPKVFIPNPEIHFFDIDDPLQHSDFLTHDEAGWHAPDLASDSLGYWRMYADTLAGASEGQLLGEDSTCYLPSLNAAERIAAQPIPIKTIICLRHPTKRAYSQYWHMLRTGRAMFSFEDTIRFTPHLVLERSMYLQQIERWLTHIPRERTFFFILEEFLADKPGVTQRLLKFLGLDAAELPADAWQTHSNRAKIPRFPALQVLKNRLLRSFGNSLYPGKYPGAPTVATVGLPRMASWLNAIHDHINPASPGTPPKIRPETADFLDRIFQRELVGLDERIGFGATKFWFPTN